MRVSALRRLRKRAKPYVMRLFNLRLYARLRGREHVLCVGDSHVYVMHLVAVPRAWFWIEGVEGATASGVLNPNSETRSREIFMETLSRGRRWQHVLLELGEVDCGFVIWRRAEREGLSVEQQLQRTLDAYETFIEQVLTMGFAGVTVMSVPLPTIDDPSEWRGHVANARREVKATQLERTQLTLRYNQELARRCARVGVAFVDVTSEQMDPATGLVHSRFIRPTKYDHHLAYLPFAELITRRLADRWGSRGKPARQVERTPA